MFSPGHGVGFRYESRAKNVFSGSGARARGRAGAQAAAGGVATTAKV